MKTIQQRHQLTDEAIHEFGLMCLSALGQLSDHLSTIIGKDAVKAIGSVFFAHELIGQTMYEIASAECEVRRDPDLWARYKKYQDEQNAREQSAINTFMNVFVGKIFGQPPQEATPDRPMN